MKQREQAMGRKACGKRRPVCGAQAAKDLGEQVQGEVASGGREGGGKAGWGTVVGPAASGFSVWSALLSPGEGHRLKS